MNKKGVWMFSIFLLLFSAVLLCSVGQAEINWTTEKPEGRYVTRKQYNVRYNDLKEWGEWSGWQDRSATPYDGYIEVQTRTLYAASDGFFVMGTSEEITMLKGTGAQMAFSTEDSFYWISTDESIASVDQTGYVSAYQTGTVTIEVHYGKWDGWHVCTVKVVIIDQGGIKLPADARTISEQAFCGDHAVSMVDLRGTRVDVIGGKAFADASALRLLLGDGGNMSVDDTAFDGSDQVTFAVTALGGLSEFAITKGLPCYLIGMEKPPEFVPVSEISVSDLEMAVGDSRESYAYALPLYATNRTLAWSSSAPEIVSVSSDGILTCLNPGTAVITVSSTDGSKIQNRFKVTANRKVSSIILNHTSLILHRLEDAMLTATVLPSDATNPKLKFSTDNSNVAIIYIDGTVRGLEPGTTVIRARAADGSGVEAACTVTVISYGDEAQYTSIWSSDVLATSAKITAHVQLPSGHNPSTFGYYLGTSPGALYKKETESSNGLSYTIENIFYTCGGLSPSTTYYYRFFMTYDNVERLSGIGSFTTPPSASITSSSSEIYVNVKQDINLPFNVSPSNASIAWSSSDTALCSVDQNGWIYPLKYGRVTITAVASANGTTSTYSWIIHII